MGKTTTDMELVPIEKLVPYVNNARTHNASQIMKLRSSLREFGFINPVIIDRDYNIIAGHGRVMAAREEKIGKVPCVFVDYLTEAQKKAYILADNRMAMDAGWDEQLLKVEIESLQAENFDVSLTGFDEKELSDLFDSEKDAKDDNFDVDKELQKPTVTRAGDVWLLGAHKLICGDSTKEETYKVLMGEQKANLVVTDPPYNVNYQGSAGKIKNDNMEDTAFRRFLTDAFSNAAMVMKPGAPFYIWHADSEGYNFRGACRDAMLRVRQCLIWVKNSLVMGRQDFQWKHEPCLYGESEIEEDAHEPCLYGWTEGKKHYFFKNRRQTTVLNFDKPVKSAEHPTMKPIKLFDYQMQCSSKPGENVLDLFAGSGTTIMAAEQNGRHAFCMEYDPKYADVIIDRWEKFTGKRAVCLTE